MGLWSNVRRLLRLPNRAPRNSRRTLELVKVQREQIQAAYDVATTNDENTNHWAQSDALSANAAASKEIRERIRQKARYEVLENNCYAKGIALTLANDTIGTGPRLQLRTLDREINQQVERRFGEWMHETCFSDKLRVLRLAKAVDGESFAHFATNPMLRHPVKLDLALSEADQWTTPILRYDPLQPVDGIVFDAYGNPAAYHRLKYHPGETQIFTTGFEYDTLPASQVIHLFRCDRPGQYRGVSEFVTALPLFAQLRRYKLACLAAAETAADLAAVMKTNSNAIGEPEDVDSLDAIPIERRAMLTLPQGWDISQLKSEHPPTTFDMFEASIIQEIGRCLNMPFNVAATNSSTYNYASGRLDHQVYFKSIDVERAYFVVAVLDRVLDAWFAEASLIPGFLPEGMPLDSRVPHEWFWRGHEHVDPAKEANAQQTKLASGTTHRAAEYAREGFDIDEEDERAAAGFGVDVAEYRRALFEKTFGGGLQPEQEPMDDDEPAANSKRKQAAE